MIEISAPWFHLMKMGDLNLFDEIPRNADAAKWWLERQRELRFTFGVLSALKLAMFTHHKAAADGSIVGVFRPTTAFKRYRPVDLEKRINLEIETEELKAAFDAELLLARRMRPKKRKMIKL
jgi:hypothetical protein